MELVVLETLRMHLRTPIVDEYMSQYARQLVLAEESDQIAYESLAVRRTKVSLDLRCPML